MDLDLESIVCWLLEDGYYDIPLTAPLITKSTPSSIEPVCASGRFHNVLFDQDRIEQAFRAAKYNFIDKPLSKELKVNSELEFRRMCLMSGVHANITTVLLDLAIYMTRIDWADDALPFVLLEELFESQSITRCQQLFYYLQSRIHLLTVDLYPTKGKGLIFLRMLNELLKRLSANLHASFCGEIRSLIAVVFPLTERSGVNLRGEYNTENITKYDMIIPLEIINDILDGQDNEKYLEVSLTDVIEGNPPESPIKTKEDIKNNKFAIFYSIFWSMQSHLNSPVSCAGDKQCLARLKKKLNCILAIFKELNSQDSRSNSSSNGSSMNIFQQTSSSSLLATMIQSPIYIAKYLTSANLFKLQLRDNLFRRSILIQIVILLKFLQKAFSNAEYRKSNVWIVDNDIEWIEENRVSVLSILEKSKPYGGVFLNSVKAIMRAEDAWVDWKSESCPPFEKPREELSPVEYKPESRTFAPRYIMGSKELARLWKIGGDGQQMSLDDNCLKSPSLEEYLQPLKDQMNPEDQIEAEYRLSADPVYRWKGLRLAAREHHLHTFQQFPNEDFEILALAPQ